MKKLIQVGTLNDITKSQCGNGIIVAGRTGNQVWFQCFDVRPKEDFNISFDEVNQELVIRAKLLDGEHVAIADIEGFDENKVFIGGK